MISSLSFKELDFRDQLAVIQHLKSDYIELNLTPFMVNRNKHSNAKSRLADLGKEVLIADGGWCNFYSESSAVESEKTIELQIEIAVSLGAKALRLFFGRPHDLDKARDASFVGKKILAVANRWPQGTFLFETHDQNSSDVNWLAQVFDVANSAENIGLVVDPANILKVGLKGQDFRVLGDRIGHIHLKSITNNGDYGPFQKKQPPEYMELLRQIPDSVSRSVEIEEPLASVSLHNKTFRNMCSLDE